MAVLGLVVISAIASRNAGAELTTLAQTLVRMPCFFQKSHFQTPGGVRQPCQPGADAAEAKCCLFAQALPEPQEQ